MWQGGVSAGSALVRGGWSRRYRGIVSQWAAVVAVCEQLLRYALMPIYGTVDLHLQVPNSCKIYCEIEQAYTRVLYNM